MTARHDPYDLIGWRGVQLDRRTVAQLLWAEQRSGIQVLPSQGSNRPATSYSGSTHTGRSGVCDIRVAHLSEHDRRRLVRWLKRSGGACWYRPPSTAWGPHVHFVSIGSRYLSGSARWQVAEYLAGRSGLVSRGADRTYRAHPAVRFSLRRGEPVPLR